MPNPASVIHIAILDDDMTFRSIATALLLSRPGIMVSGVETGNELERLLRDQSVDCVLLDHNLGDESGFQVRERLAERFDALPPLVLLTGDERQSTAIKAFRFGFDDFLPKRGLSVDGLLSSISGARARHGAACRNRSDLVRLALTAVRDPVTGLATKTALDARLAQGASATTFGLVVIEVEQFIFVAETIGASALDKALREFSSRLQPVLRSGDLCGRYAGNTFLVIVEGKKGLDALCDRLVSACAFRLDLSSVSIDLTPRARVIDTLDEISTRHRPRTEALGRDGACPATRPMSVFSPLAEVASSAEASVPPRIIDRRRETRHRVLKRGQIIISDLAVIDCTVRNLSSHGAGLRLDGPVAAPIRFQLKIVGADGCRSAIVRWQIGKDLGVEFLG